MLKRLRKYLNMTNLAFATLCTAGVLLSYHFYGGVALNLRLSQERTAHRPISTTRADLAQLAALTNETYFREVLQKIMVPRVVGTPSHEAVKEFIGSELASLGYDVEYDEFSGVTPNFGALKFTNVIGRLERDAPRYLTLACHYDSKYFSQFEFVGATDSAVPCAILLHLAKVLTPHLNSISPRVSLMLVFFDGEEAFHNWSENDSLYGARNLAAKWEASLYSTQDGTASHLDRMDVLVLLDLLGTKDSKFLSFFAETEHWHRHLSQIERKLKSASLIPSSQPLHFLDKSAFGSFIEDDHIPFLRRGVPVLHVIPARFPPIWHTAGDNLSALDFPTIDTLNKVFQVFVYTYLHGDLSSP